MKCTLRGGKEMAERKVSRFESNMESFGAWIEKYVAPPLVKFGNQRHMAAIRTAYIRIIPFIIVGSVPLILTNLPIPSLAIYSRLMRIS